MNSTAKYLSVMLIEDSESDAQLILNPIHAITPINALPLEITLALHLTQALQLLRESHFDVILLDLSLPDATGLSGLLAIKAEFPNIPIVVLTGCDDPDLPSQALKSGAQDYLLKGNSTADVINRSLRFAVERKRCDLDMNRLYALEQREMFMAMLAHDLKNPVVGLKRLLQQLIEEAAGSVSEEQHKLFLIMARSNNGLLDMINNVLDCHKLDLNAQKMQMECFDLSAVVKECLLEARLEIDSKQMVVANRMMDGQNAFGDHIAMRRVISNLVINAVKFSPAHETISISSESALGRIRLKITNTGVQISPHHGNKLFEPFYQTQSEDRTRGLGLGLHICQTMVRFQGGEIVVSSSETNSTTFTVDLPTDGSAN